MRLSSSHHFSSQHFQAVFQMNDSNWVGFFPQSNIVTMQSVYSVFGTVVFKST